MTTIKLPLSLSHFLPPALSFIFLTHYHHHLHNFKLTIIIVKGEASEAPDLCEGFQRVQQRLSV